MTDYKLMPKQITVEMADAFWEEYSKSRTDDLLMRCYNAMYAVAPQPAEQQENVPKGWRCRFIKIMGEIQSELGEYHDDPIPSEIWSLWRELLDTAEQQPALAKHQPCGCVICTCEHETQCQGCGARHCGTHPVGQFLGPVYQKPAPDVSALVEALEWYAEHAAGCRKISSEGDKYRSALDRDGGSIAETALAAHQQGGGE